MLQLLDVKDFSVPEMDSVDTLSLAAASVVTFDIVAVS